MGDKVGTAGQAGGAGGGGAGGRGEGSSETAGGSKYWRGEREKRRGEEVNRGRTHFWRDQAEFGVYLYE